ncbi:Integrin beta-PS [Halotydeus destructor]|nr:Integrin beta-PS [Halotydeus destructor]
MDDNSSNIIQLIRRNYDKISSNIELSDDAPKSVKIKYFAKCDIDDEWIESNECDEFKVGDTIEFELEITATSCALNSSERFNFAVSPVGLREESHFEIEVICECPCEQSPAIQSEHCTARGNLVCGTCVCEEGRYGGKCECDGNTSLAADMLQKCKRPSDDGKLSQSTCSGRGDCECGQCICSSAPTKADKIFGPFCECDTFSCGKDASGQSCGGPSRGQCCDGHCQCQEGWTGESCDCTTNTTECISPNGQICSGHGRCECGKCKCSQDEETGIYAGTFCEQCLTCAGKCVELEDCVRCRFPGLVVIGSDEGVLNVQDCEARCSRNDFVIVDDLSESTLSENNTNIRLCKFSDGDGCQMEFSYDFDFVEERASVTLSKKRECPSPVNMWLVIATIAGSILLIGILLVLLLRLLVYLKDKRDYAKWKSEVDQIKETKLQTMSPNPLYREANTKYQNPLYDSATTST